MKTLLFCDFDGTITVEESLRNILLEFIPDTARRLMHALDNREITIREGLIELIEAIPSDQQDNIIAFALKEPIRPGFEALLDYLAERDIPFIVLSSGLRFTIEQQLAPWKDRIHAIHALDVDRSGPQMSLILDNDHPREAMPKAWVMQRYQADWRIAIGDGLSDLEMITAADQVFARDVLLRHMTRAGLAASPFEDFYDVISILKGPSVESEHK